MTNDKNEELFGPRTDKDWFLYDLFNDKDFLDIKEQCKKELSAVDPGLSGLLGKPFGEKPKTITSHYVQILCDRFDVFEDVAIKGLFHSDHLQAWSRNRAPAVYLEKGHINIVIGPETRKKDVMAAWKRY